MTVRVDHVRQSAKGARVQRLPDFRSQRRVPAAWETAKRATDIVLASTALVVTAPILAVAAAGIVLTSPGSPVFKQERVGKNGRRFMMYKLRTMRNGAHLMHHDMRTLSDVPGPVLKIKDDPRLHALGSFLRRSSIDELPNLINVLRGEMSLVGPRPPLPSEVEHYDEFSMGRLRVKPGITCTWQISGRSKISFDEWMKLDNHYVDNWSPLGDLLILLRTVPAVISGDGAH